MCLPLDSPREHVRACPDPGMGSCWRVEARDGGWAPVA